MVGKVRVGRCRFACIHRPTDLVALVNQNEIPAKIDQTNDKPNKYKRWIHDVDYNADVEREQEQFGVGVGVVVQEKREQGQLGAGTHFIAFGSGRDLVDLDLVEKLRTSNRYLKVKEKMNLVY